MQSPLPDTVLILCTANVCRSPMAERLIAHALQAEDEPLKSLKVVSAGIAARDGDPPSENSVAALKKVGLDCSNHRSRRLTAELIDSALIVLVMTESHRAILELQGGKIDPLYLMREFMADGETKEIPDPFGMDYRAYEACRDSMVEAVPSVLDRIRELAAPEGSPENKEADA